MKLKKKRLIMKKEKKWVNQINLSNSRSVSWEYDNLIKNKFNNAIKKKHWLKKN
jgi:hypothetical protein